MTVAFWVFIQLSYYFSLVLTIPFTFAIVLFGAILYFLVFLFLHISWKILYCFHWVLWEVFYLVVPSCWSDRFSVFYVCYNVPSFSSFWTFWLYCTLWISCIIILHFVCSYERLLHVHLICEEINLSITVFMWCLKLILIKILWSSQFFLKSWPFCKAPTSNRPLRESYDICKMCSCYAPVPLCRIYCRMRTNVKPLKFVAILCWRVKSFFFQLGTVLSQ